MNKEDVHRLNDDKYAYYCLKKYVEWDDFDLLIEHLSKSTSGVKMAASVIDGPYSRYLSLEYESVELTLMHHDEMGSCFRVDLERDGSLTYELILKLVSQIE